MSVRVTCMLAASGVSAGEVTATDRGGTPPQTVTTHREARGVIVGVLDNSPLRKPPESSKPVREDDLYEINIARWWRGGPCPTGRNISSCVGFTRGHPRDRVRLQLI